MQLKVSFPLYRVGGSQTSLKLFINLSIKAEEAKFEGKLLICWSSKKKLVPLYSSIVFTPKQCCVHYSYFTYDTQVK